MKLGSLSTRGTGTPERSDPGQRRRLKVTGAGERKPAISWNFHWQDAKLLLSESRRTKARRS